MSAVTATTAARPAALGRRVGAYVVDAVVGFVALLLGALAGAGISFATQGAFPLPAAVAVAYAVALAWFFVYTAMQGGAGSIGARMTGLALVRADGTRLGFGRALGRNVIWGLGGAIVVGYFSPLFDSSPWRRGWHDKVAGAVMTDTAGRGAPTPLPGAATEPVSPLGGVEAPASDAPTGSFSPEQAAGPAFLPAGPILPPATDLAPGDQPSPPAARPTAGVISFVPGVTSAADVAPGAPTTDAGRPTPVVAAPVAPTPARGTAAPGAALVAGTPSGAGLEDTRIATDDRPVARLVWDDGARQALYGRTVFGRNPTPETGAAVAAVRDETLSLSKTHFELAVRGGALWVTDRHSTNGVVLRRGTARQSAEPGEPLRVHSGDVLEFGDRHVLIEIAP
ncbi:RDD family protein [Microbacterium telephonicum]|uniref:Putative RDD family membrane protein YckC n=1 Tax=Microbacterium telephonicum TaxID=1714841 RepID=A0A498C9D1_9MICO|nr:RDD family protein [Microbacterium telephonicum]RLK52375.1 putative RDD family membrane protein YckC [Microbacterium telephonicum]